MPAEVFPLQSKRAARARRLQIAQHLLAAFLLIDGGVEQGVHSALSILEILAGALLILSVVRERFKRGHHSHVAWVELAGAFMTLVEAIQRTHGRHHLSFILLSYAGPILLFTFAIFDAQISERRYLKADDEGLELRLRLLFRQRVRWEDIRSFRVEGNAIELEGAKKLNFRDVINRGEAMQWSLEQLRRRGITESVPQ
jgi:hypothetical protein